MILESNAQSPFASRPGERLIRSPASASVRIENLTPLEAGICVLLDQLLVSTPELLAAGLGNRGFPASAVEVTRALPRLCETGIAVPAAVASPDDLLRVYFLGETGKTLIARTGRVPYQPWSAPRFDAADVRTLFAVQQCAAAFGWDRTGRCFYHAPFRDITVPLVFREEDRVLLAAGVRRSGKNPEELLKELLEKLDSQTDRSDLYLAGLILVCENRGHEEEVFELLDSLNRPFRYRIRLTNDIALSSGDLGLCDWYQGCLLAQIRRRERARRNNT